MDQLAFFDMPPPAEPPMMMSAIIVDCWRYELKRIWDEAKPLLVVCMLNPSTADHTRNDPTILTLIHFAKLWSYGGLLVVNLFAFRSPNPVDLLKTSPARIFGPQNGAFIDDALGYARDHGRMALAAWGNLGSHFKMDEEFIGKARQRGIDLVCLGTTQSGQPKHPLARGKHRIPRDQQPIIWRSAAS
jgi:hypothetical protein